MTYFSSARRTGASMALAAFILGTMLPTNIAMAAEETRFGLRPHCSDEDTAKNTCKTFTVRDPQSFQTDILKVGDTLDLDLIIYNPANAVISRYSAWMGYDPTIFSGSTIEVSKNFSAPDTKETLFSSSDGYIKASASAPAGAKGTVIVAAHIVLKIVKAPIASTVISFYDATKKVTSHSAIVVKLSGEEQNIGSGTQSYLFVRLDTASAPASSAATSSVASVVTTTSSAVSTSIASQGTSSSATSAGTGSSVSSQVQQSSSAAAIAFSLMQVQGLRVTTDGSSAFLAWNQLNAGNLLGYNVYYGTVSGKYIQRRSVDKASTTLTVRSLPVGTKYFFAVRGVDANNQESDFSQEVAVTIGSPSTSTSPLTGNVGDLGPNGKPPANGGSVAGETGPESTMLLLIALSSIAGLMLAFRRQFTAKHLPLS